MNKNIKNFFNKKNQDYTYIILFLLTFSIFIFFAIWPSLKIIFSLLKEKKDLKIIEQKYDEKIIYIYNLQENLEKNREELYLLDNAISLNPQISKIFIDIKNIAEKNNFFIQKAYINDVNISETKKELGIIKLIVEGKINYENFKEFINDIFEQRRLKTIEDLTINKYKEDDQLQIKLTINGYYL